MSINIQGRGDYATLVENAQAAHASGNRENAVAAYGALNNGSLFGSGPLCCSKSAQATAESTLSGRNFSALFGNVDADDLAEFRETVQSGREVSQAIRNTFNHDQGFSLTTALTGAVAIAAISLVAEATTGAVSKVANYAGNSIGNFTNATNFTAMPALNATMPSFNFTMPALNATMPSFNFTMPAFNATAVTQAVTQAVPVAAWATGAAIIVGLAAMNFYGRN